MCTCYEWEADINGASAWQVSSQQCSLSLSRHDKFKSGNMYDICIILTQQHVNEINGWSQCENLVLQCYHFQ